MLVAVLSVVMIAFQFTPLREGRQAFRHTFRFHQLFQFTPLREGRQKPKLKTYVIDISIHAPA